MFVYRTVRVQYVNILSAHFIFPCFSLNEKSSCLLQPRCRGVAGDNGVATASLPRHSDGERLTLMNTVNKPPATTMCQHFLEILLVGCQISLRAIVYVRGKGAVLARFSSDQQRLRIDSASGPRGW